MLKKEENKYKALSDQLLANTNKKMIIFEMSRRKIEHIAIDSGYTLGQYWMLAIYNTISDWESNSIDQVHIKYNALNKIEKIITECEKLQELTDVLDMTHKLKLLRTINCEKLDEIDLIEDKD